MYEGVRKIYRYVCFIGVGNPLQALWQTNEWQLLTLPYKNLSKITVNGVSVIIIVPPIIITIFLLEIFPTAAVLPPLRYEKNAGNTGLLFPFSLCQEEPADNPACHYPCRQRQTFSRSPCTRSNGIILGPFLVLRVTSSSVHV
jgi:hypothetical protein